MSSDSPPAPKSRSKLWRAGRIVGFFVLLVCVLGLVAGLVAHEPRPAANPSPEADEMARAMVDAVGGEAWEATEAVAWELFGHRYLWDKSRGFVEFESGSRRVLFRTWDRKGIAFDGSERLSGDEARDAIERAWTFFCNDSFWLNPVVKAFDEGTTRSIVEVEGERGLLVSYESGGVTPGDAYLWLLDDTGRPTAWRMWVEILPVGGVRTTWEGWQDLGGGVYIATRHGAGLLGFTVENPRIGSSAAELSERGGDPFEALEGL